MNEYLEQPEAADGQPGLIDVPRMPVSPLSQVGLTGTPPDPDEPANPLVQDADDDAGEGWTVDVPPMLTTAQMEAGRRPAEPPALEQLPPAEDRAAKLAQAAQWAMENDWTGDAAPILREAARLNLSPEEIAAAPDFIKKPRLTQRDLTRISNRYPTVATLLQDPWLMAAFGNPADIKALGQVEKTVGTFGQTIARSFESWETIWIRDELDLIYGKELVHGAATDWTAKQKALQEELQRRPASRTISLSDEQRRKVGGAVRDMESFYRKTWGRPTVAALLGDDLFLPTETETEAVADLVNAGLEGGLPEAGARAAEVVAGMAHSAAQPETLALMTTGGVVGSAVPAVGTVSGLGSGAMTGIAMANYYKGMGRGTREALERGMPEDWARVAGVLTGLVNSITDTAQVGVATAPVKGGAKAAGKGLFTT